MEIRCIDVIFLKILMFFVFAYNKNHVWLENDGLTI